MDVTKDERARWAKLIDDGLTLAVQAAVDRLGSAEAVEAEYYRLGAKVDASFNGEQTDIAALVLHSCLIAVLEKSVEEEPIH